MLQRWWVPDRIKTKSGLPLTKRDFINKEELRQLRDIGIHTVQDLADADKYIILRLRGWDYPQVKKEDRYTIYDICDKRALAIALVKKCTSRPIADEFAYQQYLPRNMVPRFGGPVPQYTPPKWYGTNWTEFKPLPSDDIVVVDQWDGCAHLPAFEMSGHKSPNGKDNLMIICELMYICVVIGLGNVDQVPSIREPHLELQELTCKNTPG